MKTDFFEFISENKTFSAVLWLPEGDTKAVLQIAHGMTEHIGRYETFAEQMTAHGIAVCGFDLRGHGKNGVDEEVASFGENGWALSLNDMRNFFDHLQSDKCFRSFEGHALGQDQVHRTELCEQLQRYLYHYPEYPLGRGYLLDLLHPKLSR